MTMNACFYDTSIFFQKEILEPQFTLAYVKEEGESVACPNITEDSDHNHYKNVSILWRFWCAVS